MRIDLSQKYEFIFSEKAKAAKHRNHRHLDWTHGNPQITPFLRSSSYQQNPIEEMRNPSNRILRSDPLKFKLKEFQDLREMQEKQGYFRQWSCWRAGSPLISFWSMLACTVSPQFQSNFSESQVYDDSLDGILKKIESFYAELFNAMIA